MARRATGLAVLREHISASNYQDQDRLPPEPELAERLGLTRAQLRTALGQLSKEGIIWRHVGKGTFIGPNPDRGSQPLVIRSLNPRELMEARLALEPRLTRLAALSASQHDLDQMIACLKGARAASEWREWQQFDEKLHRSIAEASRNSVLIELYNAINRPEHKDLWGRLRGPLQNEQREEYMGHHEAVVDAIRNRDPDEAEQAIRRHLERVKQLLLNYA
jgi:DNA-binding FadR family transcriptional regulator